MLINTWASQATLPIDPNFVIFTTKLPIGRWNEVIITTFNGNKFTVWVSGRPGGNWSEFAYSRTLLAIKGYRWHTEQGNEFAEVVGLFLCNYFTEAEWTLAALTVL